MEIKQSTTFRTPVMLVHVETGDPVTGVAFTDPTVYIQKQDGTSVVKILTNLNWFEIDPVNMPGVYDILLTTNDTDTIGYLKYTVANVLSDTYFGLAEIVTNLESDTFVAVGRVLGLVYENATLEVLTTDGNGNMLTGTRRSYDSKANALLDDGVTGLIASYSVTSTYLAGTLNTFKMVRDS